MQTPHGFITTTLAHNVQYGTNQAIAILSRWQSCKHSNTTQIALQCQQVIKAPRLETLQEDKY